MTITNLLYKLFSVLPTCTDDELRQAYYRALLESHPDRNPNLIEASTVKTQQLTSAYAELKKHRASQTTESQSIDSKHGIKINVDGFDFTIQFSFDDGVEIGVDIKDIDKRKATFRNEWEKFRHNPSDPISALRLVNSAFRAERQNSVKNLLLNPILIDSTSFLMALETKDNACETLIKWAGFLEENKKVKEAVQILEDAFDTGMALHSVAEKLRNLHYAWAQYADPTTGCKATPEVRIKHFQRILELGFKFDYIYKLIAKAYHDLKDDENARAYLHKAYEINPQLPVAARLLRELGFPLSSKSSEKKTISPIKYKYSRPEQIPSSSQVHEWVEMKNWDAVIEFSNPHDYSPRILSKTRKILHQIATSLEGYKNPKAIEALINILDFKYYWDVSEAAITSLSKIGDKSTLELLKEKQKDGYFRGLENLETCISYLQERISNQLSPEKETSPSKLLSQAKKIFAKRNYGQTRILLEYLLANIEKSHSLFLDATVLLARTCAEMNDLGTSVKLIKSVLPDLPNKSRFVISQELVSWLWNYLLPQQYAPMNDENYILGLDIHLELALIAKTPDDILKNLWSLTRWLELLGAGDIVQWIRDLIRIEAPGTWYVDSHNREKYIRCVDLSPKMRSYLYDFDKRVKAKVVAKLKQVLKSKHTLEKSKYLIED